MEKSVVHQFFERGAASDIDGAWNCFSEDGVWIESGGPEPGTTRAKSEIREILAKMDALSKDLEAQGMSGRFEEPVFLTGGDQAVVEWSLRGPDDAVIERGIDLFTIRDGKIVVKDVFRKA